jgi:hypothetical protein
MTLYLSKYVSRRAQDSKPLLYGDDSGDRGLHKQAKKRCKV